MVIKTAQSNTQIFFLASSVTDTEVELFCLVVAKFLKSMAKLVGDLAAQEARLASLKGKNLLFVSGSLNWPTCPGSTTDVLQEVRKHGMKVYAVMHTGKEDVAYCTALRDKECYDEAIWVDMGGANAHLTIAEAARATGVTFAGAFCTHDHQQPLVGQVSEELGLPGNPVSAYEAAKDKFGTRKALLAAGLATPAAVQVGPWAPSIFTCVMRIASFF